MAQPKCPSCSAEGTENISAAPSQMKTVWNNPVFRIVYCSRCGHIHGIVPQAISTDLKDIRDTGY